MPEITVNIEIFCAKCGAGLCNQTTQKVNKYAYNAQPAFEVEPCQKCLDNARDEAREEGYNEGVDDGRAEEKGEEE